MPGSQILMIASHVCVRVLAVAFVMEDRSQNSVSRLDQANQQAIREVKNHIQHWTTIKKDYTDLSQCLSSLPEKLNYDIMVPFGPMAFMPGKLVHTNEIMVHLGDSWFADVTCHQALKIVDHRMKAVDKNLEDLDKTMNNLSKKTEFSKTVLENKGSDSENIVEIKEEIPRDYVHPSKRKRISRVKDGAKRSSSVQSVEKSPTKSACSEDELMKRLKNLEVLDEESLKRTSASDVGTSSATPSVKKVTFDVTPSGKNDEACAPPPLTIKFKHTPTSPRQSHEEGLNPGHVGKQPVQSVVQQAVSDVVQEHVPQATKTIINAPKKVSKFKASRK